MMKYFISALLLISLSTAAQAGVNSQLRQAGKLYNAQKYGSALNTYNEILRHNPNNQRTLFNAGNAYYRLQEYTQAEEAYKQAAEVSGNYQQSALYNLANAYYRAGNKEKAIETYQAAILQDPQDKEAIHNLQLIIQEKQQDKNDNKNNQDNQNNQSDNQDKQNQDNKGQAPQQEEQSQPKNSELSKSDADRIMSMAKEKEYNRGAASRATEQTVDKDW